MLFHRFGGGTDPLHALQHFPQGQYLRCYLSDLDAKWVVEEPSYFDRDYLDEYAAYYSTVASSVGNQCRRLHFFEHGDEADLRSALAGPGDARTALVNGYLGFTVLRPLDHAPFGRTVLRWYPDDPLRYPGRPRIVTPSRDYRAHIAGLPFDVRGLAWQQQDGAVALCATTGLWSLLHSSAFDDHHAVPTTADVTRFAYESLRRGSHVFPASDGLDVRQMVEAIARAHLQPVLLEGDQNGPTFRREKFAPACAVLIRSGYPVLISGRLEGRGGHVICATGFREAAAPTTSNGVRFQDTDIEYLYVHDDNLGANVRMRVSERRGKVRLKPSPPPKRYPGRRLPDPTTSYPGFIPEHLIAAVHEGLRITPDELHRIGMTLGANLRQRLGGSPQSPITVAAHFVRIAAYLDSVLVGLFPSPSLECAELRMRLAGELPPMSLHVGVIRIGYGSAPLADVLIDTSDRPRLTAPTGSSGKRWNAFGTVLFAAQFKSELETLDELGVPFGQILTV